MPRQNATIDSQTINRSSLSKDKPVLLKDSTQNVFKFYCKTIQNKWNIYNVTAKSDRFAFSADLNTIDRTATHPLNSRQSAQNCNTADFPFLPSHILQLVARELNQEQLYKWTLFWLHRLHAPCALPVQSKWKEKKKIRTPTTFVSSRP